MTLAISPHQALAGTNAPAHFPFHERDRVVFLGDSITFQHLYTADVAQYLTDHFPELHLTFQDAGMDGEAATGAFNRFKKDIIDAHATVVVINLGMNDGGGSVYRNEWRDKYLLYMGAMLDAAAKHHIRAIIVEPHAVDAHINPVYQKTQERFYAPLASLAAQNHAFFIDLYGPTRTTLNSLSAVKAKALLYDSVHPTSDGGVLLAQIFLKALGIRDPHIDHPAVPQG